MFCYHVLVYTFQLRYKECRGYLDVMELKKRGHGREVVQGVIESITH